MDLELDLATAERLVKKADPTLRATSVSRLTGGGNSGVFEVATQDGSAVVVKVYSDEFDWKLPKEVFVYDLLRQGGVDVPVPAVLAADDSKALLPQNAIVLTKVEGEHVLSLLDRLDEAELTGIARQVGAMLRSLHGVTFDEFGYVGTQGIVEPHATNLGYMGFQFAKKLREFEELGGDEDLRRTVERHVAERDELFAGCTQAVFCHNDCHEGNVLVLRDEESWRISGLLDFENVLAGDPLLDLAKAHCYARRRSNATLDALAAGYGDLRDDWREALDVYVLYHQLELWDWFAFIGNAEPLASLAADMRALL